MWPNYDNCHQTICTEQDWTFNTLYMAMSIINSTLLLLQRNSSNKSGDHVKNVGTIITELHFIPQGSIHSCHKLEIMWQKVEKQPLYYA